MEYLMTRTEFKSLLSAVLTSKCIQAKLWENSKHVARQLDKIGPTMANALVNAGLVSFKRIEEKNPREIELVIKTYCICHILNILIIQHTISWEPERC